MRRIASCTLAALCTFPRQLFQRSLRTHFERCGKGFSPMACQKLPRPSGPNVQDKRGSAA